MEICNFEQPAGDLGSFLVAAHTVNTEFGAISNFFFEDSSFTNGRYHCVCWWADVIPASFFT